MSVSKCARVGSLLAAVLLLATSLQLASAKYLEDLSFAKPFDGVDADGIRTIGKNFKFGGNTAVSRHFARLTPDRQSKCGHIWSKEKLGVKEFTMVLTFRISGQAKSWFGDGLALWLTKTPKYVMGDNHGFIGEFKGVGVVFDTFVNEEHAGGHKDVTVFQNDGSKSLDQLIEMEKMGCTAPGIRYHERNAAFSPALNTSRAKVQYSPSIKTLQVSIDADNTGNWVRCYTMKLDLDEDWPSDAYVGITASTGGLADNHDVLSLFIYDDVIDSLADGRDVEQRELMDKDLQEQMSKGDNDAKMKVIKRRYVQLIEEFEYQFTALKESTGNTVQKIREQNVEDERRIVELERWASGQLSERVSSTVNAIRDQVSEKLESTVKETAAKSSGWKTPFLVLMLVLLGLVGAGYKKYQDLRKSHLL